MFQVPTVTAISLTDKKTTGAFTKSSILLGQVVWCWEPLVDKFFPWSDKDDWTPGMIHLFQSNGYRSMNADGEMGVMLCGDNARFVRHSVQPNLVPAENDDDSWVAARTIAAGEELTISFHDISLDADASNTNSEWLLRRLCLPKIPFETVE